ncbi:hypothetical protein [Nocardioides insulae]|uniref:hypothetical protein n=1 Tax=Nocardioides insulae TaxID=394734 RepID=UPI000404F145|nr:hypothetical protein [Nocardioides insulae]
MPLSEIRVDDDGIHARSQRDAVVDVLFDGRRIFSYWVQRDGVRQGQSWTMRWPEALTDHLDGVVEVTLTEHASGEQLFSEDVRLGSGEQRIEYVDRAGRPLALDKYFKRTHTFETRSDEQVRPLLDAIEEVLGALHRIDVGAFVAYGTLLGAVRGGALIGHDNDADLGYVSEYTEPADVIAESFRIQRRLIELGYPVTRYSGLAFKVDVEESDGNIRGLDVFGGFMRDGQLHLMGEIRTPFRREWIYPLGSTTLEGRELAAPADTDRFLAATYGPNWRTPDPAFHFETPTSTTRRLNGWFRGIRVGRALWDRIYATPSFDRVPRASAIARDIADEIDGPGVGGFIDVGCGRGRDVGRLSSRGVPSIGFDVHPRAFRLQAEERRDNPLVTYRTCNLLEVRHVVAAIGYAAALPGPRVMLARHLLEVVPRAARANLYRMARTLLTEPGDRMHLEFLTEEGSDDYARYRHLDTLDPATVRAELARAGARVVHEAQAPVSDSPGASRTCRMVAVWATEAGPRDQNRGL